MNTFLTLIICIISGVSFIAGMYARKIWLEGDSSREEIKTSPRGSYEAKFFEKYKGSREW